MEKADFKKLLDEQAKRIEKNIDRKLNAAVAEYKEYVNNSIKKTAAISKKHTDGSIKKAMAESQEKTERYVGAIYEDFQSKFQVLVEYVKPIGKMQEDLKVLTERVGRIEETGDATFERVGELSVEMGEVKLILQNHEQRITVLEKR